MLKFLLLFCRRHAGVVGGGGVPDYARHAQRHRNPPTLGAKVRHDPPIINHVDLRQCIVRVPFQLQSSTCYTAEVVPLL